MVKSSTIFLAFSFLCFAGAAVAAPTGTNGKAEFEKASKYFEAEEYEAALPYFLEAYELSGHRPATIFALAQCERALKIYDRAIAHFREYLATGPDRDRAIEVKETLQLLLELEARAKQEAAAAAQKKAAEENAAIEKATREKAALEKATLEKASLEKAALEKAALEKAALEKAADEQQRRAAEEREREREQLAAEQRARTLIEQPNAETSPEPAKKLPQPAPASPGAQPMITAASPILHADHTPDPDSDSILSSPWFWLISGALVAGGATTATVLLLTSSPEPYAGSTGVILEPKD